MACALRASQLIHAHNSANPDAQLRKRTSTFSRARSAYILSGALRPRSMRELLRLHLAEGQGAPSMRRRARKGFTSSQKTRV